jgi:hypothetical protein
VYVHADDIRAAIGRPTERTEGLKAAVAYLMAELDKGGFDTKQLRLDEIDHHEFVLVATGRAGADTLGLDPSVNIYAE